MNLYSCVMNDMNTCVVVNMLFFLSQSTKNPLNWRVIDITRYGKAETKLPLPMSNFNTSVNQINV